MDYLCLCCQIFNSAEPVRFFEVEHSTSIYSGLLRLNDVKVDYPINKANIVAPKDRRNLFETQMLRRTFNYIGLNEVCEYLARMLRSGIMPKRRSKDSSFCWNSLREAAQKFDALQKECH